MYLFTLTCTPMLMDKIRTYWAPEIEVLSHEPSSLHVYVELRVTKGVISETFFSCGLLSLNIKLSCAFSLSHSFKNKLLLKIRLPIL